LLDRVNIPLVSDELTNGHRLTTSLAYVTTRTYASTSDQWARLSCPLLTSSKTKPCQFSSVQLRRSVRAFSCYGVRAWQLYNQRQP